jgi:hypothetical protein
VYEGLPADPVAARHTPSGQHLAEHVGTGQSHHRSTTPWDRCSSGTSSLLALLAGALSPPTTAGVRAFVPHLVDDAAIDHANPLAATSLQFSYLAGPVTAGFAVARLGGPWALFVDVASLMLMGADKEFD